MKPTIETDRYALYLGDCRDVLPTMEAGSVDCVLTDPPWLASKAKIVRPSAGVAPQINKSLTLGYGDIGEYSPDTVRRCIEIANSDCLFIVGYKELGEMCRICEPLRGVFAWKKHGGMTVSYPAAMDLAFVVWSGKKSGLYGYQHWKSSVFDHAIPTAGCITNGERVLECKNGPASHPAQGPVSLYTELIRPLSGTVADPYMGTGTCGVAAMKMGRRFIGIEIEPKYFAIAARRIEEAANHLFATAPSPPTSP